MTMQFRYKWKIVPSGAAGQSEWVEITDGMAYGIAAQDPEGHLRDSLQMEFRDKPQAWEEGHTYTTYGSSSGRPFVVEKVFDDGSALGWMRSSAKTSSGRWPLTYPAAERADWTDKSYVDEQVIGSFAAAEGLIREVDVVWSTERADWTDEENEEG